MPQRDCWEEMISTALEIQVPPAPFVPQQWLWQPQSVLSPPFPKARGSRQHFVHVILPTLIKNNSDAHLSGDFFFFYMPDTVLPYFARVFFESSHQLNPVRRATYDTYFTDEKIQFSLRG